MGMRHPGEEEEAPSPRPSAAGCYAFLRRRGHGGSSTGGYRRLESSSSGVVRVEVGKARSVYHVDAAVLEAEPVRRLLAAAGRRGRGGAVVAVAVDALLFEHLLWLAVGGSAADVAAADLSEIVEFYSQDDEDSAEDHRGAPESL